MESRDEMVRASLIKPTRKRNTNYVETLTAKPLVHVISKKDTIVKTKLTCGIGCFNQADIEILRTWQHEAKGTYLNRTGPPENPDKREVHFRHRKFHHETGDRLDFKAYWKKVKAFITKSERKKK